MTPALWADLGWLLLILAALGAGAVALGVIVAASLEWRDAHRAGRDRLPR